MKKKFLVFLLIFSCLIFGGISTSATLFADENSITSLSSTVILGSGEAQKENGNYIANFKLDEQNPYDELTYRLAITTAPLDYVDLTPEEKDEVISKIQ